MGVSSSSTSSSASPALLRTCQRLLILVSLLTLVINLVFVYNLYTHDHSTDSPAVRHSLGSRRRTVGDGSGLSLSDSNSNASDEDEGGSGDDEDDRFEYNGFDTFDAQGRKRFNIHQQLNVKRKPGGGAAVVEKSNARSDSSSRNGDDGGSEEQRLTNAREEANDQEPAEQDNRRPTKDVESNALEESGPETLFRIKAHSSRQAAVVTVNSQIVMEEKETNDKGRGINCVVLNQFTGKVTAVKNFDTFLDGAEDALMPFLESLHEGRIVIMAIKDEGSFMLHEEARQAFHVHLNAVEIKKLHWRDMYVLISKKGSKTPAIEGRSISPDLSSWGDPVERETTFRAEKETADSHCKWPDTSENRRRREFCGEHEGYGALCRCKNPDTLDIQPVMELELANMKNIPVIVMAGNRPQYLYRGLRSLLSAAGARREMITVFIDGFLPEVYAVTQLLGVRGIQHEPKGEKNGRICYHYKYSLTKLFDEVAPDAPYTLIVEEDLEVAPDFYSYFSQTMPLMDADPTLYCVSAWNDNGYLHSTKDASLLYRIETMPGLGWLLSRKLYKGELEDKWPAPENRWDWDMWMRLPSNRKERECIIPDISRTYHFGASGVNMNYYFQKAYFGNHRIATLPQVKLRNLDKMNADMYEQELLALLRKGIPVDHTKNPCKAGFFPFDFLYGINEYLGVTGKHPGIGKPLRHPDRETGFTDEELDAPPYLIFFAMRSDNDYENWIRLAQCFRVWDLDVRGHHKGLFRFWLEGHQIMAIGERSPYNDMFRPVGIPSVDIIEIELEKKKQKALKLAG